jgi:hypothetical protein
MQAVEIQTSGIPVKLFLILYLRRSIRYGRKW